MGDKQLECGGFTFLCNFDSANLSRVELVPRRVTVQSDSGSKSKQSKNAKKHISYPAKKPNSKELPDYEFNIWTNPDCVGTEFENCNRTWFHFGITGGTVFSLVKLNVIDLNKQSKMYSQGMAPVYKIIPGKCQWERITDKPVFTSENNVFTISFKFRTTENVKAVTYFAFTYPFSFTELQSYLGGIDVKMSKQENHIPKPEIKFNKGLKIVNDINDAVYYHRETLCYSLENRKIDLITISSHHNITSEREPRLQKLFPDENNLRPFKFQDKKVIFISARVHPGETPSSFVMNGILNLLTHKDDPIAILLRRQFVFKLIPMLNPDGVARGHYRTDTRGCNLNRYYLNPSREFHPAVFGARSLIRYHHYGEEVGEDPKPEKYDVSSQVDSTELTESDFSSPSGTQSPKEVPEVPSQSESPSAPVSPSPKTELTIGLYEAIEAGGHPHLSKSSADTSVKNLSIKRSNESLIDKDDLTLVQTLETELGLGGKDDSKRFKTLTESPGKANLKKNPSKCKKPVESGLFLYLDMHGHASKKGVFMYGNHFDKIDDSVECMLFPKIMSINSQNFHFSACNFTEKNMYLRDKRDGTSREGSGRVAVLRLTGLIRSYTLECNYNTGRFVNKLPQCCRDLPGKSNTNLLAPPKYSPVVYEEIGRSLCISFLDLTNSNPWSRIPNSEYHTLFGIRDWLRLKTISDNFLYHRPVPRSALRSKQPSKSSQTQVMMGVLRSDIRPGKLLPNVLIAPLHGKPSGPLDPGPDDLDRKEKMTYRSGNAIVVNRKEAGPSHGKRPMRVSSALQVRAGVGGQGGPGVGPSGCPRTKKSLKKTIYWTSEKLPKFKQFGGKGGDGPGPTDEGHGDPMTAPSDSCLYKQSPKRLKTSKGDEGPGKVKMAGDWSREDVLPGPSSSDVVAYARLTTRPGGGHAGPGNDVKKRGSGSVGSTTKAKQQSSPMKFKKSLEKRRGSDASRKKSKTLFKKAGKIILTNDMSKTSVERKRRKN